MAGIFISYRRSDIGSYAAGRLQDALARRFGREHVFMDIDSLKGHAGLDFKQALDQAVSTCDVMLALIGPEWLAAADEDGTRRLDDPEDWVRLEIATALARTDIRVIPVLMGEASMPRTEQLPEALKPLARRQSTEISERRWEYDVEQLIDHALKSLVRKPAWRPNRRMAALSLVVAAAGGGAVAAAVWREDDPDLPASTPEPTRIPETPEVTATQTLEPGPTARPTLDAMPIDLTIEQDFIPVNSRNLPGVSMLPTYITVHETGNPNSNANSERAWLLSNIAQERQVSYHWVVDDERAIQLLPYREAAWHTGDEDGNDTSIGVYACVFGDGERQAATRRNLATLLAALIRENDNADFSLERVVQHNHWVPETSCPQTIRAEGYWPTLIEDVR